MTDRRYKGVLCVYALMVFGACQSSVRMEGPPGEDRGPFTASG